MVGESQVSPMPYITANRMSGRATQAEQEGGGEESKQANKQGARECNDNISNLERGIN